jgi:hypothetical protein
VSELFTKGSHHRNNSLVLITQNLFHQGPSSRDISLNSKYIVVFKNPRDNTQIVHLARQVYPEKLLSACYGENSLKISEQVVSYFPKRVYNGLEDLAETIMNPANCHSSRVPRPVQDNWEFATPEPVYVYTDIIKPNLVGDSYVRVLTTLRFPSFTG